MSAGTTVKEPTIIVGFEDATPLLGSPDRLRAQAERDGYLFFKGLLPRTDVLAVRRELLQVLYDFGWLRKDADLMDGLVDHAAVANLEDWGGTGVTQAAYLATQKIESFHRLSHHPNLIRIYQQLFGKAVLPHPRNIARLMVPSPTLSPTPMHQDFIHIQGTRNVWTAWIPLGDVPRELGGLSVLRGSHKEGVLAVTAAKGAGGLESIICNLDLPWIEHDYQAGDVLTFQSCTVHKSLPNHLPDRVARVHRLSLPARGRGSRREIAFAPRERGHLGRDLRRLARQRPQVLLDPARSGAFALGRKPPLAERTDLRLSSSCRGVAATAGRCHPADPFMRRHGFAWFRPIPLPSPQFGQIEIVSNHSPTHRYIGGWTPRRHYCEMIEVSNRWHDECPPFACAFWGYDAGQ